MKSVNRIFHVDGMTIGFEETGRGTHHAEGQMFVHAAKGNDSEIVG